jgi:hypothetical protein
MQGETNSNQFANNKGHYRTERSHPFGARKFDIGLTVHH